MKKDGIMNKKYFSRLEIYELKEMYLTINNLRSLLVLDSFREYLVESVKNRFNNKQTNITVIPNKLISKL